MPLLLVQLGTHPSEIAATKVGECKEGGAFFLDFSRPLRRLRWLIVWNEKLGYTLALYVPVVHQGQVKSNLFVAVDRGDPSFPELHRLWNARFPSTRTAAPTPVPQSKVSEDFALQFPTDATKPVPT